MRLARLNHNPLGRPAPIVPGPPKKPSQTALDALQGAQNGLDLSTPITTLLNRLCEVLGASVVAKKLNIGRASLFRYRKGLRMMHPSIEQKVRELARKA